MLTEMKITTWRWVKWAAACGGTPPRMCGSTDCARVHAWLRAKVNGIARTIANRRRR